MTPEQLTALVAASVAAGATPEQLAAIVAAANGNGDDVPGSGIIVEASPKASPKKGAKGGKGKGGAKGGATKAKTYTWRPWACARFAIPAEVGATFEYASKRSNTTNTHKVTAVDSEGNVTSVRVS